MYPGIPPIESFKELFLGLRKQLLTIYKSTDMQVARKEDNSPVTEADILSQRKISDFLKKATNIPILSEEQEEITIKEKYMWIVDPLDGTQDFINHTGEFAIMIGFVEDGSPIFGVVYQPVQDKLYYANKGQGAYLQIGDAAAKKLRMRSAQSLNELTAVISRHHFLESDKQILAKCAITKKIHCGSVGVKIGLLCEGKADVFFNTSNKTSIWDTCASQIIIEEAGGIMTDLRGEKLVYDQKTFRNEYGIFVANKLIYGDIVEKLTS